MRVIYNGVDMGVLRTHLFSWEPVFDDTGTDYLFTRVQLIITAIVNGQVRPVTGAAPGPFVSYARGAPPGTTSTLPVGGGLGPGARLPGNFLNTPISSGQWPAGNIPVDSGIEASSRKPLIGLVRVANAPPLTHITIRHRLNSPRSQLFIFSGPGQEGGAPLPGAVAPQPPGAPSVLAPGATLILASPNSTPGVVGAALCDSNNGPKPTFLNITAALGDATTFIVDWGIETFVVEAVENGLPTPLVRGLLSNRFAQAHEVDEEGYTTSVTNGVALFRTDVTFSPPAAPVPGGAPPGVFLSPDLLRPVLFEPIQPTFIRKVDYVRGVSSAVGVEYQYTDTQQRVNFHAAPFVRAAQIQAHHRQIMVADDVSDLLKKALDIATSAAIIVSPFLGGAAAAGKVIGRAGAVAGGVRGLVH